MQLIFYIDLYSPVSSVSLSCITFINKKLCIITVSGHMFTLRLPRMEKQKPFFRCLQASLPVQEYLFMPFDQAHKQYETARHLPPPLYVLFVQATAYGQACGEYESWVRKRGCGSRSHGLLSHSEALPTEESSQALVRSPQVTNATSPLLCPAWLLCPAGLKLD